MKTFVLISLIYLTSLPIVMAGNAIMSPDTTVPKQAHRRPVQMILPGYQLDTAFSGLATPEPAVYQSVPKWLRAKTGGRPIYVINGQTASARQLKTLRSAAVASVQVIDGKQAMALYGSVAREGVVAITTKTALKPKTIK